MRARCKRIGSVADVGPIVLIDKVRYAHHSETLAGDKPKNVEFLVDNNAMLSNLCSSLVGDGKWLAQAMADYTMKKIPLVAFNMSRAGCEDELRVCKYPEEVGLAEAVSAAIEKRSDEVLAAEKTAAEQQEDDAKAEWKQFTEAVNKWRAEKASKASTKEGEAKAEL